MSNRKPILIILEGPDRIGKSTQAENLISYFSTKPSNIGLKYIKQPSPDNSVGFIRPLVKTSSIFLPFERQLLHTVSHIVDAYEEYDGSNIIKDRSFISALVYGSKLGLTEYQINLIKEIHTAVYNKILSMYSVYVILIYADQPFTKPDDSHYEAMIENTKDGWVGLKDKYIEIMKEYKSSEDKYFFNPEEKYHRINVTNLDEKEVFSRLVGTVLEELDGGTDE